MDDGRTAVPEHGSLPGHQTSPVETRHAPDGGHETSRHTSRRHNSRTYWRGLLVRTSTAPGFHRDVADVAQRSQQEPRPVSLLHQPRVVTAQAARDGLQLEYRKG